MSTFFTVQDLAEQQGIEATTKARDRVPVDPVFTTDELAKWIKEASVPSAAFPPPEVLTPDLWREMCRDRPCKDHGFRSDYCWYCSWAKGINGLRSAMTGARESRLEHDPTRPRWPNVYAALRDYAEHLFNGREPPSASGPILDNIKQGAIKVRSGGMSYRPDRADPTMAAVEDFVAITRALSTAYDDNRWGLAYGECVGVLLLRDAVDRLQGSNNVHKQPTYEEIAAMMLRRELGDEENFDWPKILRAVAARGRHHVIVELCARELMPMPARDLGLHIEIDQRRKQMAGRSQA